MSIMEEIYKGKGYPSEQVVPEKIVPSREETEDDDISKIEIDVSGFLKENKSAGCDKDSA